MCVPTLAASPLCSISGIISSSPCASVCLHFLMKYNTDVSVVGRSLLWPKKLTFNVLLLYSLASVCIHVLLLQTLGTNWKAIQLFNGPRLPV